MRPSVSRLADPPKITRLNRWLSWTVGELEERGAAMGITFGVRFSRSFQWYARLTVLHLQALLVGPAVAPLAGGIATECILEVIFVTIERLLTDSPNRYASWRLMQAADGCTALLTYFLMYVGMPNTSHPGTRGIGKEFGGRFRWCG